MIPKSEIKEILIRSTNWVGDVVITLPALEAVRKNFPKSRISILARPWVAPMLEGHPAIDDIIPYEKRESGLSCAMGIIRMAGKLRKMRFDLAILFQNAFEAALLVYLAGIRYRIGYNTDGRGFLLSHSIKKNGSAPGNHQVEYYLNILRSMDWEAKTKDPKLAIDGNSEKDADILLEKYGVSHDELLIGLSPGAIFGPAKRWPAERFAKIGDWAVEKWGSKVVVLGSSSEEKVCGTLCESMVQKPLNFCGNTTLRQAMAIIKRCRYFVTNDSGLMHIAAALDVPLVAIFGSTDHIATGPRNKRSRIVRLDIDCAPCLKAECLTDFRCMLGIEPERVWAELESLREASN